MLDARRALVAVDRISMIPPVAKIKIVCPKKQYLSCGFYSENSYDEDGFLVGFKWKIDGQVVSNDKTFFMQFGNPDNYLIELQVTDNRGLMHSTSEVLAL